MERKKEEKLGTDRSVSEAERNPIRALRDIPGLMNVGTLTPSGAREIRKLYEARLAEYKAETEIKKN
jgi:hypothetical protein